MTARIYMDNDRLLIHSLEDKDLDGLIDLRNDLQVYRFEPTFLAELQGKPEEALRAIQSMDLDKDRQCILGIYEKNAQNVLIGLAEFYDYKQSGKVISIGVRLMSQYWGKGIASSCIRALIDFLQKNTQVEIVTAHIIPENKASSRCVIKNGFEHLITKTENWGHNQQTVAEVYTLDCI